MDNLPKHAYWWLNRDIPPPLWNHLFEINKVQTFDRLSIFDHGHHLLKEVILHYTVFQSMMRNLFLQTPSTAWISLIRSYHLSLSVITLGNSSSQHPVLSQSFYLSANTGTSVSWSCWENVAFDFILTSLNCAQHFLLGWFVKWEVNSHTATVLSGAVSRICSKEHASLVAI